MSSKSNEVFSGVLGEEATLRKVRGKLVVKNRPRRRLTKPKDKPVDGANRAVLRFAEAVQYAKQQTADPGSASFALYKTGITARKRSAFMVALTDYLSAPKVHYIDGVGYHGAVGERIMVKATDNFQVTKVIVMITDAAGNRVEEGEAGADANGVGLWGYKATTANPALAGTTIRAIAYDRPGNMATLDIKL